MLLFHGTSATNLSDILSSGVNAESYWGTLEQARSFSNSFDDGIILQADIDENDLRASILMAESLYDSGDLDEIPDEDDIDFSIENLGGCVCLIAINDFSVVVQE
jgi:hypothetical protein